MLLSSTTQTAKVFISYRNVKTDKELAIAIEKALTQEKLEVFIDYKMLPGTVWSDEIDEKLNASNYFIVLLSAESIESDMVRQEVKIAHRLKGEGKLNIIPIRVNYTGDLDFDFSSSLNPIHYISWQKRQPYEEITDVLIQAICNPNNLNQQQDALIAKHTATEKAEHDSSENHYLPDQPDHKFIDFIKEKIADELNSSDVTQFRDVLKQELDKSLKKLELPAITDNQVYSIVDGLITVLKSGKTGVPVITSVLSNSAMHCFDKRGGKYYHETLTKHAQLKETIEQMLGWLVLASVDDEYAQNLRSDSDYLGVYFELPVVTTAGVEFIVSRRYQHQAKIKPDGSTLKTQYNLPVSSSQLSWQPSETVDILKRMLWNQVFPDEKKEIILSSKETDRLNAELEIRQADEWAMEHHLIAIECEKIIVDTKQKEVYRQLLKELSNLTLVQFGVSNSKPVFCVPEHNLMGAINRFLNNINNILES